MARIVVIGAGMAGLAVAARLAVKRHNVTIVEQSDSIGGKAGGFSRDGFVFDTGPSLLTLPAVYRDLFLKTGTALEDNVDLQPVDPGTRYRWSDGFSATLPGVGIGATANALGDVLGGTARDDWVALMDRASKIWQLTRRPVLESPVSGMRDLLPLARNPADLRTVAPHRSMHGVGRRYLRDPRLRVLLDRYATYAGSDPRKAPAALVTIPYVEQAFGSWHIGGGIHQLAVALGERCRERGVSIELGCDVTRIVTGAGASGAGVSGVELSDGRFLPADKVVANADAWVVYDQLTDDSRANGVRRNLRRSTPSFSGFVMMLAVKGRTPGIAHHNVWFPEKYEREFTSVFRGRQVEEPAIYACVPDDPAMRPDDDHESWFILVNAPRDGLGRGLFDWSEPTTGQAYATKILEQLAARGCDIRDRILWQELRTPHDLTNATRAPGGAIYGTSSNGARSAFLRPANTSPIPGLYLVGGSAHPGGGLPLVGLSAEIVANLIGR